MHKVGDKFEVFSTERGDRYVSVGDVVTLHETISSKGSVFLNEKQEKFLATFYGSGSGCSRSVRPLRTEAEKRGAKFGVGGVEKNTGRRIIYNYEVDGYWRVMVEGKPKLHRIRASNIRLDHEPEYKEIPFSDATHEQRMDVGNLIIDGGFGVSEIMKFDMAGYVYTLRGSTKVYIDTGRLTIRIPA